MFKPTDAEIKEFLVESNAIEGVYGDMAFNQALKAWKYLHHQKELTKEVVKKVHGLLMVGTDLNKMWRGYFRLIPVYIGGKEALKWEAIEGRMDAWCMKTFTHPEHWKEHHIEYEKIHPFVDGNGRTGRMFMNWERLKGGLPLLIIHAGSEQQQYYEWFK